MKQCVQRCYNDRLHSYRRSAWNALVGLAIDSSEISSETRSVFTLATVTHDRGAVVLVIASQSASDTHLVGVYHTFLNIVVS